ncbi:MAG: hypothetical protein WA192_12630 [Candidatus Acidiferrales bacterium]
MREALKVSAVTRKRIFQREANQLRMLAAAFRRIANFASLFVAFEAHKLSACWMLAARELAVLAARAAVDPFAHPNVPGTENGTTGARIPTNTYGEITR